MKYQSVRKIIRRILNENHSTTFNAHKYNSFSELTDQDLHDIAFWGLMNDFQSNSAWECAGDKVENIDQAIHCIIDDFKLLLKTNYPEGFNNTPNRLTIYRILSLKSPDEFNYDHAGYSWFSNSKMINNNDFRQQIWSLKADNLYLATAIVPLDKIDIPRSLFQRQMSFLENEIVLKDDSNVKVLSVKKLV